VIHQVTMRGPEGAVKWGYHTAASLGSWSVTGQTLTAKVVSVDTCAVTQQPLTFVVPRPRGAWRWTVTALHIADGTLTASVSPQE
jgi:hypothetical protein